MLQEEAMRIPLMTFRLWILGSTILAFFVAMLWAFIRPVPQTGESAQTSATTAKVPVSPTETAILKAKDVSRDYRQLRLMTKYPVSVDPALAGLCRGMTPGEIADARKRSGPHAISSINIFMNNVAVDAFQRSRTPYPVGSVIVKEKCEYRDPVGVGGMIKRPPGYDPENGDWEYFYSEATSALESGKIGSCVECHRGASSRDYVFADWANQIPPAPRSLDPPKPE
jgi:Cytochrome P460